MKKIIFTTLFSFLLLSASFCQNSDSQNLPEFYKFIYEEPQYLYGDVKEIQLKTFDAFERNGKITKGGLLVLNSWNQPSSSIFNSKGQIIQWKGQSLMGNFNGVFHYENEKLIKIFWLLDESLKYVWEYSYPEKGKVKNTINDIPNNTIWGVYSYELDKNGLRMKEVLQQEGMENNTLLWEREDNGTITDKKVISPDGKIVAHMDKWEYNTKGSKSRVHRSLSNGEEADFYGATHTYEYDDKGNWIKRTSVNPNGMIRVTERKIVFY